MPNEELFQTEISAAFRTSGYWVAKWPDLPVSIQRTGSHGSDGKIRFTLPRPYDLQLCSPVGIFGAIECKLNQTEHWKLDDRAMRQLDTLRGIASRPPALAAFAVNIRYRGPRKGICNRAFLLRVEAADAMVDWRTSLVIDLEWMIAYGAEIPRITGGWNVRGLVP